MTSVLASLFSFVASHLHLGDHVTVDLPDVEYCFPQDVNTTDRRPDLVIWSENSICLIELTIPFEAWMDAAVERKQAKYEDLVALCATNQRTACLTTVRLGQEALPPQLVLKPVQPPDTIQKGAPRAGERHREEVHHALP